MQDSSNSKFWRMRIRMPKFSKINSEAQAAFEFEHPEKLKGTQPNHSNSNQQKLMRELSNSNSNTAKFSPRFAQSKISKISVRFAPCKISKFSPRFAHSKFLFFSPRYAQSKVLMFVLRASRKLTSCFGSTLWYHLVLTHVILGMCAGSGAPPGKPPPRAHNPPQKRSWASPPRPSNR